MSERIVVPGKRLGRRAVKRDTRTLRLASYLRQSPLPNTPPANNLLAGNSAILGQPPQQPLQGGISSALKDLITEVSELTQRTRSLRDFLGISVPDEPQNKAQSNSLLELLAHTIRLANNDLGATINHLNS